MSNKFIIKNILIEKSEKDIKTGIKHTLNDGFNLICGDNEAGKSSLMSFIKQGFFRDKGLDSGKIYFDVDNKSYRADIKDAKSLEQRCKIFDENGETCNYSFIEKNIKKKYFEEGFTINLDDLMKIQNKETEEFINIIKDPSGDKLNHFLEKINENIETNLSADFKPKKSIKELIGKITALENKIRELSSKEQEYNHHVNNIKIKVEEIKNIINKENYLIALNEIEDLIKKRALLLEEKKNLEVDFSEKLYDDKEQYIALIQSMGEFNSNKDNIEKCSQKLELTNQKIMEEKTRLSAECGLSFDDKVIENFNIDYEKLLKIKEIIKKIDNISNNINLNSREIENLENDLMKLNCEIEEIAKNEIKNFNYQNIKNLVKEIDEGLKQYYFLSANLETYEQQSMLRNYEIKSNKKIQIILIILLILSIAFSGVCIYQNNIYAGIFSTIIAIITIAGLISLKVSKKKNENDEEKERKIAQKNNIILNLKNKIIPFNNDIINVESVYLPTKIENIKQEFQAQINNYESFNQKISDKTAEKNFKQLKIDKFKKDIISFNNEINELNEEIKNLSDKNISNNNLNGNNYLDAIEILKSIKSLLENKISIEKEKNENIERNNTILLNLKNFIMNNEINILVSEDIQETLSEIKTYYEKNNLTKQNLEKIEIQIGSLNERIKELEETDKGIQNFTITNIELQKNELINLREEKEESLKNSEYKKRELEKVEGIFELKTEKNILIEEYRNIIKKLIVNQMTLELTKLAKNEFDKTQPDLINAQKYLAILTDNKYTKINLELQELENSDGTKIKKWEHLSRGTKEQLYLALRLGYASNYSKDKTTLEPNGRKDLPLIIDDAFVNFDTNRTKNALKCLYEFSKTNQVLFFTCHSQSITEMIKELKIENINLIQL